MVIGSGPADERASLGLRTALALGLGGFDVVVWLTAAGALLARRLDAGAWLGSDPAADLDGIMDDLGGEVLVDEGALVDGEAAVSVRRPEMRVAGLGEYRRAAAGAAMILGF